MSENVIKFKPREKTVPGSGISEKQAWENYEILKGILRANIEYLHGNVDEAWFLLTGSPFDFGNKPDLISYVLGYYRGWISSLLEELETDIVKDSYLGSSLVSDLDTAMQLMEGDHLTRIQIWIGDDVRTIVLHRTWDIWGIVNFYTNGVSMHEGAVKSLKERGGKTDQDLFHWKEAEDSE